MAKRRKAFGQIETVKSTVRGRPDRFRARYTGPDTRRYSSPTFGTLSEADDYLRTVEREIRLGTWEAVDAQKRTASGGKAQQTASPEPRRDTFATWAELCLTARQQRPVKPLRPSTAALYRQLLRLELNPTFGELPVPEITEGAVNAWHRASSAKGHPTQTANAYLLLQSIMNEAAEARLIDASPCRVPGAKGKPAPVHEAETMDPDELRRYLEAIPDESRLPLMIAALCGLRSGEVRALRVRDVDPRTGRLSINQGVYRVDGQYVIGPPKTRAGVRTVFAPELLRAPLAAYVKDRPMNGRDGLLFTARDGLSPLHASQLRRAHQKGRDAINRPTLTVHDLRRTAATLAAQEGATVRELMALLGHTTPDLAMRYQSAAEERMKTIAARLDAALTQEAQ